MERKEFIDVLEKLIEAMQGHVTVLPSPERIEALRMAVRSLKVDEMYDLSYEDADWYDKAIKENEQLKKELEMLKLDRDCISREATKQAIRDFFPNLDDRCEINSVINMQPTVYPKSERPMAHWIERFNEKYKWLECDNCHGDSVGAFNYCPHCGAKMVEPQESEDKE